MINLCIQPAQPAPAGAVQGRTGSDSPPALSKESPKSFEKALRKARRQDVPDDREQTLAAESMPGQKAAAPAAQTGEGKEAEGQPANTSSAITAVSEVRPVIIAAVLTAELSEEASPVKDPGDGEKLPPLPGQPAKLIAQDSKLFFGQAEEADEVGIEGSTDLPAGFSEALKKAQTAVPEELNGNKSTEEKAGGQSQPENEQLPLPEGSAKPTQSEAPVQVKLDAPIKFKVEPAKEAITDKEMHGAQVYSNLSGSAAGTAGAAATTEPARLAEAHQIHVLQQVSDGIASLARIGQNTLRLQLFPENLGKIDLRMTIGKDGLQVTLSTDAPVTGSMLSQHLAELRTTLADAGVNLAGLSVNTGDAGGQYATNQRQAANSQPHVPQHGALSADQTPEESADMWKHDPNANVDYLV